MKEIDLESLIDWDDFYLNQAIQGGHGQAFVGTQFQRGYGLGSIFQSLFRFLVPIGKTIGRAVGKEALHAGTNIAADMLDGHTIGEAARKRGHESAKHLVEKAQTHLAQSGAGKKRGKITHVRGCKNGRCRGGCKKKKPTKAKTVIIRPAKFPKRLSDIFA